MVATRDTAGSIVLMVRVQRAAGRFCFVSAVHSEPIVGQRARAVRARGPPEQEGKAGAGGVAYGRRRSGCASGCAASVARICGNVFGASHPVPTRHGYRYALTHPLIHQQGREHHCIHGTTRSNGFDSGGVRAGVVVVVVVRPGIV